MDDKNLNLNIAQPTTKEQLIGTAIAVGGYTLILAATVGAITAAGYVVEKFEARSEARKAKKQAK